MADDNGDDEVTTRRAAAGRTSSIDRGRLEPSTGAHAAQALPDSLNIRVDLPPAPRPEMPEDEVAVAIDDVAVNPGTVVGGGPTTTSVEVITPALSGGYRSSYRRDPSPYSALLASRRLQAPARAGQHRHREPRRRGRRARRRAGARRGARAVGVAHGRSPHRPQPHDPSGTARRVQPLPLRGVAAPREPRRLRQGPRAQGAQRPHPATVRGRCALRAGAHPQGRRGQDDDHGAPRHGPGRRARRPHHRDRRESRPRHARRAGRSADPRDGARRRDTRRRRSAATPTSRASSRATRRGSTSWPPTPIPRSPRRSTTTTTTSSRGSPPGTTRSCSPTAAPASCTR